MASYLLAGGRCAVDVVFVAAGVSWWRARLDVRDVRFTGGPQGFLRATVSSRAQFASVPMTRRRFMSSISSSDSLEFSMPNLPELATQPVLADGVVTAGDRSWLVRLGVRVVADDEDRIVLEASGSVVRDEAAPLVAPLVGFDAAAELIRCD
ncbi:MAG TPA: hypothetical protein VJ831_06685 [Jatrophihabitantaceae bacterium]|nr:hypothetical protein [Jatrophihabitantaceae bacterium]